MRKFSVIKYLLLFIGVFVTFSNNLIVAKGTLETAVAPGKMPDIDAGKIILYDDYTLSFEYGYRVNNIKIWVCLESECGEEAQIVPNQTYIGNTRIDFDLSSYINFETSGVYTIKAMGNFKHLETDSSDSMATLNYRLKITQEDSFDGRDELVLEGGEKAVNVINTWVVPLVYIAAALTILIKAIFLSIDLVKYSDNKEVRVEKIKSFVYLGVAVLAIAIISSSSLFIAKLFY